MLLIIIIIIIIISITFGLFFGYMIYSYFYDRFC